MPAAEGPISSRRIPTACSCNRSCRLLQALPRERSCFKAPSRSRFQALTRRHLCRASGESQAQVDHILSRPTRSVTTCLQRLSQLRTNGQAIHQHMSSDMLIVGCGVLGTPLGKSWLSEHDCKVIGETNTDSGHPRCEDKHSGCEHLCSAADRLRTLIRHGECTSCSACSHVHVHIRSLNCHLVTHVMCRLQALGIQPQLRSKRQEDCQFDNVVFCAPPSGSEDYVGEVGCSSYANCFCA